jgi:hypothetical protein
MSVSFLIHPKAAFTSLKRPGETAVSHPYIARNLFVADFYKEDAH